MRRGIVLGVPGAVIVTGAGLLVETRRVAHAPLPHFEDLDPSGTYGPVPGGTPQVRISVLGDSSVTAPGLASGSRSWIAQLAARLPVPCELRSHAKGGSRVRDVLEDQCGPALDAGADLFVLAVGANDVMHATPLARFRRDTASVLEALAGRAPVLALGIGDLSIIPRLPPSLRPLVRWRSRVLDGAHDSVTRGLDGVTRVSVREVADPLFADPPGDIFTADRFHPNELGHTLWARGFEPFVLDALGLAGSPQVLPQ
ncbi:MAG: GDSL-type esterase/lipase family protein [Microthrixaceae bacterium]